MIREAAVMGVLAVMAAVPVGAQKKPSATTYDVTINADNAAYTGTMDLAVVAGKVTGNMHITKPGEITGNAVGNSKAGKMNLDFPYHMVQRNCDGRIAMAIDLPPRPGPAKGTAEITECDGGKLTGTVEMTPKAAVKAAPKKTS
ncbi:MAG: hypothetical protein ABIS06_02620 [Vicinamibacterales bacterium]